MDHDLSLVSLAANTVAIALFLVLSFYVRWIIRRHDRLRDETAAEFLQQRRQLADLNSRLTQAGYPPGRLPDPQVVYDAMQRRD